MLSQVRIVGDGVGVGVGFFTATPLLQTNFLPDLTHVNVLPAVTKVIPALLHLSPALAAAFAGMSRADRERESIDKNAKSFLFIISWKP
jgi:hypothetical protein